MLALTWPASPTGAETVIAVRKGRDATWEPWKIYLGLDTMEVAARVAFEMDRLHPDAVMVDVGGVGAALWTGCVSWGARRSSRWTVARPMG